MSGPESSLPCRSLMDHAASGPWQMAVDEVLLETAARDGLATLRFYAWSEPTLSLGYFQSQAERRGHVASRACPLVRRQTGGGAILHDREITYSLAMRVPAATAGSARLYEVVHEALVDVLNSLSVDASISDCLQAGCASAIGPEPFLCFLRRGGGDVLVGGAKVCGSAQRRRWGAVLQHGSLLLARSPQAPELPGLEDLLGRKWPANELILPWRREIASRLGLALNDGRLSATELDRVRTLAVEKYDSSAWNARR